jgi:hypothetical protein
LPKSPNATTRKVIAEFEGGKGKGFSSVWISLPTSAMTTIGWAAAFRRWDRREIPKMMLKFGCFGIALCVCLAGTRPGQARQHSTDPWDWLTRRAVFASHAALTSGATMPPAIPSEIVQSGYYAPGDGGWAEYDWSPTSTATADGVAVILPIGRSSSTPGRYVLRVAPGSGISPVLYGAKGDNTTDDTAAIQAALTGAVTIGIPLYFDCNHLYKVVSGSLTSSRKVIIKGCPPVGNDGVGNAQNCLSGIDASGLNAAES